VILMLQVFNEWETRAKDKQKDINPRLIKKLLSTYA